MLFPITRVPGQKFHRLISAKRRLGRHHALHRKLKLIVNEARSRVVPLREAAFLGFNIMQRRVRWSEKSKKRFKGNARYIIRSTHGVSPSKQIAELQSYVHGAINHSMPVLNWRAMLRHRRFLGMPGGGGGRWADRAPVMRPSAKSEVTATTERSPSQNNGNDSCSRVGNAGNRRRSQIRSKLIKARQSIRSFAGPRGIEKALHERKISARIALLSKPA